MHRRSCRGVTGGCAHGLPGKLSECQQARQLRRAGLPLAEIASRLGVSKSSVSLWVRDVSFDPLPRPPRQAEIDRMVEEGRERIGRLSEREFLVAGVALYAGEEAKRDGALRFANSDPRMSSFSAAGFDGSSRSTSPACGSASIRTKASTWRPRSPTGRR
jgi:hypothetical protein